mmetsp:Transcript_101830/g.283664  ORF Transcript_101830/g.283664 Transcript_101830/m.283664 type:complete len:180 (-) Transcript_101830:167-706(-)
MPPPRSRPGVHTPKFQSVLNQWVPRRIDDSRLCALATPRAELKEPDPPLTARSRALDMDRIRTLAQPRRQAMPSETSGAAPRQAQRAVDIARLAELAEPTIRRGAPTWEVSSRMVLLGSTSLTASVASHLPGDATEAPLDVAEACGDSDPPDPLGEPRPPRETDARIDSEASCVGLDTS